MKKTKKKKKKRLSTILIVAMLLAGLTLILYPTVSSWWNDRVQSRAVATYQEAVESLDEDKYAEYLEAAISYNEKLAEYGSATTLYSPDVVEGYDELLDVTGTGIMGYITIEKIDLQLPIYHGTDTAALAAGAGHLEGSSLPVGGESTHTVLPGHRGLPTSTLFTHLDQLEVGDTFTITVLDELLTYEVDQIKTVLPTETEDLYIKEGQDLCTLVTCTPYGINTHRLLIRGHRIENKAEVTPVTADAYEVEPWLVAIVIGILLLIVLLIVFLILTRKRKTNKRDEKGKQDQLDKPDEQDTHDEQSKTDEQYKSDAQDKTDEQNKLNEHDEKT